MKELRFYGASDDLFECEGAIREEIGCFSHPSIYHLRSSEGEMQVIATYTDIGCWSIGVCQINEDVPIPKWESAFSTHEKGYSVVLTMQVPDDTVLVQEDDD
ncbi:hypothetical protein HII27_22725 [Kluyvera sp. SCKS090646]|uniref:Uncharacterized protein n=1 Tax=Kluyvera sichuanensis TaxID=2725494 RepID=A0ABR6RZE1_9ENTR|nr:hypothetical protein [Kluyvera sichuanensis]MBC1188508.1 hypothetical protein [Kluyvera sichuanensis]